MLARRWPLWLLGGAFALLMLPLLAGAWGAFPAADDFVYATRTRQTWADMRSLPHVLVDAWRYAGQIYRNWQGTFFGALVMALNPAVFTIAGYGAHAWALLAAYLGAAYALLRAACGELGLGRRTALAAFLSLAALQWVYAPDLLEGLYWFNSAWFYTMAHAVWMLALALALRLPDARTARRKLGFALLWLCCAALGLDNYITAMLALCSLTLLAARYWRRQRRRAMLLLAGVALLAAGLAVSALAPGNAVRLATETQHPKPSPWLLLAGWQSVLAAAGLWARFLLKTPLLACCVLAAPWMYDALRGSDRAFGLHPLWAAGIGFALLCAMVFPHMYSTGYAGPSRVVNLYFFYCALAAPACAAYTLGWLIRRAPGRRASRALKAACVALALALALFALVRFPPASYASLVRDLASGEVAAYRRQTLAQFEALDGAEAGSDAAVVAGPYAPSSVAYVPFMLDPSHWANVAVADYFDLRSVRLTLPPAGE